MKAGRLHGLVFKKHAWCGGRDRSLVEIGSKNWAEYWSNLKGFTSLCHRQSRATPDCGGRVKAESTPISGALRPTQWKRSRPLRTSHRLRFSRTVQRMLFMQVSVRAIRAD